MIFAAYVLVAYLTWGSLLGVGAYRDPEFDHISRWGRLALAACIACIWLPLTADQLAKAVRHWWQR